MVGAGNLLYMINIDRQQKCEILKTDVVQARFNGQCCLSFYSYGQLTQIHPEVDEYKLAYAQVCWIANHLTQLVFLFLIKPWN